MTTTLEKITEAYTTMKICSYCGPYTGLRLAKGKSPAALKSLCSKIEYKVKLSLFCKIASALTKSKEREEDHVYAGSEQWTYRSWPDP